MRKYFSVSLIVSAVTFVGSCLTAYIVHKNPFATLTASEILPYGAVNGASLFTNKEVWLLISAQLIHQKQGHMIFNVGMSWYLGRLVERAFGSLRFAAIYWIGGTIGTFASVYFLPDLISSGASQALMSLCAAILFLKWRGYSSSKTGIVATILTLTFQIGLDLYFSHSLKPGHTYGFLAGIFLSALLILRRSAIKSN